MINLDLVTFGLWNQKPFTVVNSVKKSTINVAELYWQGSDFKSYSKA